MSELAQIIYTIEGIPHDLTTLFNEFTNIFTKKEFWIKGTKFQIMDIGPRENVSTTFQLFPAQGGSVKMKISFIENPSSIDVFYDKNIEIIIPKGLAGKMMRKMIENQKDVYEESMDLQMIPLIKSAIQESIRQLEEEEEETKSEGTQDPLQILKIQFAKGEISEELYLRKKKILEE
ncbi:MAG: SHOCT domain-containing protein [Candidatus Lokiarchaeia archaeon]